MKRLVQIWQYIISEPSTWLLYCFFQPDKFRMDFEERRLHERIITIVRLLPMIFFYAYPAALIVRTVIYFYRPDLYPSYAIHTFLPLSSNIGWFVFDATWATALSCLIAATFGALFGLRLGISFAVALALANGIIVNTTDDTFVGIIFGIAFGIAIGIAFNSAHILKEGELKEVTIASALGIFLGLVIGFLTGTIGGYWSGTALSIIAPTLQYGFVIGGSIVGLTVGGMTGCLITALLGDFVKRSIKDRKKQIVSLGIKVAIAVASVFGVALGIPVGDFGFNRNTFTNGVFVGIQEELIVGVGFLCFYLISYYRLPLYPVSAYSMIQAYISSKRQPLQSLYHLRHSALHWDEYVFPPLPCLKNMLLLSSKEDLNGTLDELNFIVYKRPLQAWAVQEVAYELALRDLEKRTGLHDISLAHERLAVLLPHQTRALSANAEKIFQRLEAASRAAASYDVQINKQNRQIALEQMLDILHAIHTNRAFRSKTLNHHLNKVVDQWSMLAIQGKETLQSVSGSLYIENPYAPGKPLELGNPLFVGRNDVVQKLSQELQKKSRPTFLLTGERRMGKSSILKQLPVLLGPHYLPIFYDLQTTGMIASIAAFFFTLIVGIEKQLKERGLSAQKLERSQLNDAMQQGELRVYDLFEQWLTEIEQTLEEVNCTLILMFDEFERLEEAERRGTISLDLLFNWFRSVIQNRSQIVLLFSGAKLVGDMGRSWAGYFVNVERIKVSFLRETDAYELIVQPAPHIFNELVAREIMRITHCHPFLIQALCKHLIEILIADSRDQMTLEDIAVSVDRIFESWGVYFWDLWDRCDADQRIYLLSLLSPNNTQMDQTRLLKGYDKRRTLLALEKLQMRDLVIPEGDGYQISIPIFAQWIEQKSHLHIEES